MNNKIILTLQNRSSENSKHKIFHFHMPKEYRLVHETKLKASVIYLQFMGETHKFKLTDSFFRVCPHFGGQSPRGSKKYPINDLAGELNICEWEPEFPPKLEFQIIQDDERFILEFIQLYTSWI